MYEASGQTSATPAHVKEECPDGDVHHHWHISEEEIMKSAKLVALGLAAAMTASLAACGASSTPAAGSSSGKSGGNVIKIGVFEPTTGENGGGVF